MNEQPQNIQPEATINWKFIIGFLGWYLVIGLIYGVLLSRENDPQGYGAMIIGGFIVFPAQIITLIILFLIKRLRNIGWGMLSAIGLNMVISLILGLVGNAVCFVPFLVRFF